QAANLWKVRDALRDYLGSSDKAERAAALDQLQTIPLPEDPAERVSTKRLDTLTRLALRMPPPLHEEKDLPADGPVIHRAQEDGSPGPTEYAVVLPPEYHPLRIYPAVVALHDGHGPKAAIAWWRAEAARRGYIVIAPEYRLPDQGPDYTYTASEHAAVELA